MLMQTGQAAQTTQNSGWSGELAAGVDSRRRRSDLHGRILRFANGETYIEDNAGGMTILDNAGRIVKTIGINQQEIRYEYDAGGRLSSAQMPGMPLLSPDSFTVDSEGTLSICNDSNSHCGLITRFFLDGSIALVNRAGRLVALQANLPIQLKRLRTTVKNIHQSGLISEADACAFEVALRKLLQRTVGDTLIGETGTARTLFHISRLLEHSAQSPREILLSFQLAHELLLLSATPQLIENTDALSTIIRRLFFRNPDRAVEIIAQMSIERRYVTANGITVPYTEELMDPRQRRLHEWQCTVHGASRVYESNRFLRVVLVNMVEQLRIAKRVYGDSTPQPDQVRAFSTREYGGVFDRETIYLFEAITGMAASGSAFDEVDSELDDVHKNCACG